MDIVIPVCFLKYDFSADSEVYPHLLAIEPMEMFLSRSRSYTSSSLAMWIAFKRDVPVDSRKRNSRSLREHLKCFAMVATFAPEEARSAISFFAFSAIGVSCRIFTAVDPLGVIPSGLYVRTKGES